MFKLINVIKSVVKATVQPPRRGGVNEVKPLIGRGATLSQLLTGTQLIHLNAHRRRTQTQTAGVRGRAWIDRLGGVNDLERSLFLKANYKKKIGYETLFSFRTHSS